METGETPTQENTKDQVQDPSRRRVIKGLAALGLGGLLSQVLSACGFKGGEQPDTQEIQGEEKLPVEAEAEPVGLSKPPVPTEELKPIAKPTPQEQAAKSTKEEVETLLQESLKEPLERFNQGDKTALEQTFPLEDKRIEALIAANGGWQKAANEDDQRLLEALGQEFSHGGPGYTIGSEPEPDQPVLHDLADFLLMWPEAPEGIEKAEAKNWWQVMNVLSSLNNYYPVGTGVVFPLFNREEEVRVVLLRLDDEGSVLVPRHQDLLVFTLKGAPSAIKEPREERQVAGQEKTVEEKPQETPTTPEEDLTQELGRILKEDLAEPLSSFKQDQEELKQAFPLKDQSAITLIEANGGWRQAKEEDNGPLIKLMRDYSADSPGFNVVGSGDLGGDRNLLHLGPFILSWQAQRKEGEWTVKYSEALNDQREWRPYPSGQRLIFPFYDQSGITVRGMAVRLEEDGSLSLPADQRLLTFPLGNFPSPASWVKDK